MEENLKSEKDIQVYEFGYHLLPTVPEENIVEEAANIHSIINQNGGSIIAEGMPMIHQLSYEITKKVETKNLNFNKAYFGWIKFETDPSQVSNIKNKAENLANILRFLIIKTVREDTIHVPKIPMFKKENHNKEEKDEEHVKKPKISEADIDKSIDELVVNSNL